MGKRVSRLLDCNFMTAFETALKKTPTAQACRRCPIQHWTSPVAEKRQLINGQANADKSIWIGLYIHYEFEDSKGSGGTGLVMIS